ncbi:MAG TPA: hypothetical protein VLJ58_06315 [Ramlibacter sp.]|nr:hypothetical protein [Ramlibacter sp.]
MRRWLLLMMIVLLPLRSWAGDTMAVQMAGSGAVAKVAAVVATVQAAAVPALAGHPPDCPGHAAAAAPQQAAVTPAADKLDTPCGSCLDCQACSTVALDPPPAWPTANTIGHVLPAWHSAVLASTPPARLLKPPIS